MRMEEWGGRGMLVEANADATEMGDGETSGMIEKGS